MELGSQIRNRRQALGLSQDQLAERVYATRQSVSNWENFCWRRSFPRPLTSLSKEISRK